MASPKIRSLLERDPDFEGILLSDVYSAETISRFLRGEGISIGQTIIKEYRRERRSKGTND